MAENRFTLRTAQMTGAQASAAQVDEGLRTYMLKVYNYMSIALGLTGVVAYTSSTSQSLMSAIYGTPLQWVVMLAPLGLVFFLSAKISTMKAQTAQVPASPACSSLHPALLRVLAFTVTQPSATCLE